MSKRPIISKFGNDDTKQGSLLSFVSRLGDATKTNETKSHSPSAFKYNKPKEKSQTVSLKRKSSSFIEISDDDEKSSSPIIYHPIAKRSHTTDSDDDFFASNDRKETNSVKKQNEELSEMSTINDIYAKYASPSPRKKIERPHLTPDDKFDLDAALNSNDAYVNAMKKLDENLQQIQQSQKATAQVPKPSVGKFKFNKPRGLSALTNSTVTDLNSTITSEMITKSNGSSTSTVDAFQSKTINSITPATKSHTAMHDDHEFVESSNATISSETSKSTESMSITSITPFTNSITNGVG